MTSTVELNNLIGPSQGHTFGFWPGPCDQDHSITVFGKFCGKNGAPPDMPDTN
jgi:hypothetical protein